MELELRANFKIIQVFSRVPIRTGIGLEALPGMLPTRAESLPFVCEK
jgi:hypothetical protein